MKQRLNVPGAVILGSDFKALGVVRSLGKHGIPSIVIDNCPRSAWFSRYVVRRIRWQGAMDTNAFLDFLLKVGAEHHLEQWVLYPLQDEVVELVARNSLKLATIYRLVTQPWNIIRWANDKRFTYRMAQELEVPCPKTWYPLSEDDLKQANITFPIIIKPAISVRLQYALRVKALLATNWEELIAQYHLATSIIQPQEILLQEIIPGDGYTQYSVATFCKVGNILLSMTARRTRQYPIYYGLSSSFVEAVEVPELLAPTTKLLRYMQVSGMVEVEFKQDLRDNQYKLLDINVRPWGWHTLCIACGLDFPYIQYRSLSGEEPEPITPRYDRHWVRLLTDILAGLQEIHEGITSLPTYLRSLMGKTVFSVFDWHDLLPVFGDFFIAFSRYVKDSHFVKRFNKISRRT